MKTIQKLNRLFVPKIHFLIFIIISGMMDHTAQCSQIESIETKCAEGFYSVERSREVGREMSLEELNKDLEFIQANCTPEESEHRNLLFNIMPVVIATGFYYKDEDLLVGVLTELKFDAEFAVNQRKCGGFNRDEPDEQIIFKKYALYQKCLLASIEICLDSEDFGNFFVLSKTHFKSPLMAIRRGIAWEIKRYIEEQEHFDLKEKFKEMISDFMELEKNRVEEKCFQEVDYYYSGPSAEVMDHLTSAQMSINKSN